MKIFRRQLVFVFTLYVISACKSDFDKYWEMTRDARNSPITELTTPEGFRFDMTEDKWAEALNKLKPYELDYHTYYDWQLGNSKYAGVIREENFYEGKLCSYEIWIEGKHTNGELVSLSNNDISEITNYYKHLFKEGTKHLASEEIHHSFKTHVWSRGNMIVELLCPLAPDFPIMIICQNQPAYEIIENQKDKNKSTLTSDITPTVEVKNSLYDGSVKQVKEYLKYNYLRDPNSYESIEWSEVKRKDDGYYVRHKYRAKNGLGGYVVANQLFHLDFSGNVIDVTDLY